MGRTVMKAGNFVAKYDYRVNKAKVFKDRKKAAKRVYSKHAARWV